MRQFTTWFVLLIALAVALPEMRTLVDDAVSQWDRTQRTIDSEFRSFFARQYDVSPF